MFGRTNHPRLLVAALAAATLGLGACAEAPLSGPEDPSFHSLPDDPFLRIRKAVVCKEGTAATFEVSVNGGTTAEYSLGAGECATVHEFVGSEDNTDLVSVTEMVPVNTVLDSISGDSVHGETVTHFVVTGTNTYVGTVTRSKGIWLTFWNRELPPPPPPQGGEGCTPGYWKQSQHFDSWPAAYTPNMQFSAVFEDAFPGMTLLQVLSQGGGGLKALGRHTVAALLNSGSDGVDYDMNTAGVIAAFNAVFPGGDYEGQKNIFASFNEQGCDLN